MESILGAKKANSQAPKPASNAPAGFSSMQPSIMGDSSEASEMPEQPQMQEMTQEMPQEEAHEEIATIQEQSMPVPQLAYNRANIEEMESLIESIVEEKWRIAMEPFGDFNLWKERVRTEIISIKQELLRIENRFENLEKGIVGKVHEYDSHVLNIGAELKALEKVFQRIVQPLTENIKELSRITGKLKK